MDLDLAPPFLFFLDAADAGAAGPGELSLLRSVFISHGAAAGDAADADAGAAAADADAGPADVFLFLDTTAGATSADANAADAFAAAAASFLSAVACLAAAFFRS